MLLRLDSLRRRHRRRILIALAALALATAALAVHASLANSAMDGHGHESDTVTVCAAAAATLVVVGAATFALTRLPHRPLWTIPAPRTPALADVRGGTGFLVRAGPPPALLQVFRF